MTSATALRKACHGHELSLAHLTLAEATPVALIEAAAAGGFASVSLCLSPSKADQIFHPVVGQAAQIREIKRSLAATGLRILDIEAIWLTPERDAASYQAILAAGAELGARFALVIGNHPDHGTLREEFARLCEIAQPYRITMMLEFIPYLSVNSLAAALDILRQTDAPNRGLMIDALHLSRSGASPAALKSLPRDLFGYCQICDARAEAPAADELRAEARAGRLYPGEGALPLTEMLRTLPADTALSLEAPAAVHADLSLVERAKLAGRLTRRLVECSGSGDSSESS